MIGRNRFYMVVPHQEPGGQARVEFSVDTGIQGAGQVILVDDLIFGISSANSSLKSYSIGPWLLAIIPFPTPESNAEENIQLNVEIQSKKGATALDLRNLKLILPDKRTFYPERFYYRDAYPPEEFNGLWKIDDRNIHDVLLTFAIPKRGILNFDVDVNNVFPDKKAALPVFHFEEKSETYMDFLP